MILGQLVEEVKLWNTPVIGAYLLWKFTRGYCENHPTGDAPIGLLLFLASAILTNKELLKPISNQRSDLQSYVRSFEDSKYSDILLNIHDRVREKRAYTMASIDIAIAEGLLIWDTNTGKIYPRNITKHPDRGMSLKKVNERDGKKAEILGKWFSSHNLSIIASYLKVIF